MLGHSGTGDEGTFVLVHCGSAVSELFWFLQVRKKNVLKDFVTAAGPLGVTHFLVFTKTENCVNLVSSNTDLWEDIKIL